MGLYICLYFNFNGVEPQQWEEVYEESKILLDRFPIDLIRYKPEKKYGLKRGVFTTKLVAAPGKDDEFWRVDGDLLSGKRAETFILHKKEYAQDRGRKLEQKDVLWVEEKYLDCIDGNGYTLFETKTQGYPYHFAMLAAAMLFESRFPMNAYVTGDIEPWQVEVVMKWITQSKILSQPLLKPVCMDGPRLWNRLKKLYPDNKQVLTRFKTIFHGSDQDMLETLFKYEAAEVVRENFFAELDTWNSLSMLGAKRLIMQWLNTTCDLKTLIRFTCLPREKTKQETRDRGSGKFKLKDLLRAVCRMFIHIPLEEREPLLLFSIEQERLHTIGDMFARTFMLMGGARDDVNFYMSPSELFDIFCKFEPDQDKKNELKEIIENTAKENREYLDKIRLQIEELKKEGENTVEEIVPSSGAAVVQSPEQPGEENMEQVIISSALSQKTEIPDPEALAKSFTIGFKKFIDNNKEDLAEFLDNGDRKSLLKKIIEISFKTGIALKEKAWKDIDKEKRIPVLKSLLFLVLIKNDEYNFWHWRIYLLEHKSLWKYIALDRLEKEIGTEVQPESLNQEMNDEEHGFHKTVRS